MRKIALVGTAASALQAPYDDESWEIWGVSARGHYVTRADRWFEMHRLDGEPKEWRAKWREMLKGFVKDLDLYMLYPECDLGPSVKEYPSGYITDRFGTYFLTSTFAWMAALAIAELRPLDGEEVEGKIGVWGVDMEYATEYAQQRAGFRHFLDMARAMSIGISRVASGGLSFEPVPYPMWQDDPMVCKMKIRAAESKAKLEEFNTIINRTRTMIAQNRAIKQALGMYGGKDAPEEIERIDKEYQDLLQTSGEVSKDLVHWQATYEEQAWTLDYITP